jgi:phosphate transport system protein
MAVHLQRQITQLKKMLLSLGAMVEEAVAGSIESVVRRDADLAAQVITGDREIDRYEMEVEEECLHTLALHQPVAFDLRFVIGVLKMNHDLERIADHAANVADQGTQLMQLGEVDRLPYDLRAMGDRVQLMLRKSLDALVNVDVAEARAVRALDDAVDEMNRNMYPAIKRRIREDPEQLDQMIHLMTISRQMERIADHACNIAKDVLYMAEGEILRHDKAGGSAQADGGAGRSA